MKRYFTVLATALLLCSGLSTQKASAQSVLNGAGALIGKIEANGTLRNSSGFSIGQFKEDGSINKNGTCIGKIESDGTVRNNGTVLGKIEKDGTVLKDGAVIGKIDDDGTVRKDGAPVGSARGIKKEWAAAAIFFYGFYNL